MQGMKARWIYPKLLESLNQSPAVALLGPRQVGKTTLAQTLAQSYPGGCVYLDLEAPEDLFKLSDPASFFSAYPDRLIILDEIQRVPDLFPILRGVIDRQRAQGKRSAQFLLLGSASMDLMRQSSESLAGRIRYLEMGGFNVLECPADNISLRKLWFLGGFPESQLAPTDEQAMDWLEDFIRTYLEREVPQMGFRIPSLRLRRLWTMLAHLQGELANDSKLAVSLEMNGKSVRHYIEVLCDLLLLRRLNPWHANVKKRLVKSPRYYIRDSGIQHRLLGLDQYERLLSHPGIGKSWEGFVIENIHAVLPRRTETYFYRTAAGAEIDLLIVLPSEEIWAVEIKYGLRPKLHSHFKAIASEVGATRSYVIYSGEEEFPLPGDIVAVSLRGFMQKLDAFSYA